MTFREKYLQDNPGSSNIVDDFVERFCPDDCGYEPFLGECPEEFRVPSGDSNCNDCWNREMPGTENEKEKDMIIPANNISELDKVCNDARKILDSGNRREFESGAVRDCPEGKGRCDLLPLDVVAEWFKQPHMIDPYPERTKRTYNILTNINHFQNTGATGFLIMVLNCFLENYDYPSTMFLEIAIHFEEGAKKYGDNNWQKGIPVRCYIDSAVRHYLKFLRGDKDEYHDRAFCWNILCAIWTCKHKPELNEYAKVEEK